MSDTSPLLMNMGAEVAKAAGMQPNPASNRSTGGENDEFAGILQSVLAPASQPVESKPLIAVQAETDPLLLGQLDGLTDQLLQQQVIGLEALPDGKDLPDAEQELAWQAMLAEYDSENPETPRVIIAAGDKQGEHIEEFTPEELLTSLQLKEPSAANDTPVAVLKDGLPADKDTELNRDDAQAIIPLTSQLQMDSQDSAKSLRPELGEATTELAAIDGKQPQLSAQEGATARRAQLQAGQSGIDADKKSSVVEDLSHHATDAHKDTTDANLFKAELNAAQDNLAAKQTASSSNGTNSAVAATAYSTVSGLGQSSASSSPSAGPVIATMTIPPQNPSWGEVIGDRVQWMTTQNIQEAKIQLNPPELGMLEVRVRVGIDQQTSISFSSPHAQVRDALETAVPRLREMFADNGLSLGDVNVSHHSMAGQGQNGQGEYRSSSSGKNIPGMPNEPADVVAMSRPVSHGSGMLDLYA